MMKKRNVNALIVTIKEEGKFQEYVCRISNRILSEFFAPREFKGREVVATRTEIVGYFSDFHAFDKKVCWKGEEDGLGKTLWKPMSFPCWRLTDEGLKSFQVRELEME